MIDRTFLFDFPFLADVVYMQHCLAECRWFPLSCNKTSYPPPWLLVSNWFWSWSLWSDQNLSEFLEKHYRGSNATEVLPQSVGKRWNYWSIWSRDEEIIEYYFSLLQNTISSSDDCVIAALDPLKNCLSSHEVDGKCLVQAFDVSWMAFRFLI